jgi:hypothetical protein
MPSVIQRSFAGGVLAPALHGRADVARYPISAKTLRNFIVRREGSVENRPGTEYLQPAMATGDENRLVPFVYNPDVGASYVIEWAPGSFFLWSNGARVFASPTVWAGATAYTIGDVVSNGGSNYYCIEDHTSGATSEPGVGVDTALYWYGPMLGTLLEIPHPFAMADLRALRYVQANDVLTLTHPGYEPRELRRYSASKFAFAEIDFEPAIAAPTGVSGLGSAGGNAYRYAVTAVSEAGEESLPGVVGSSATITAATVSGNTVTITAAAHGFAVGDIVQIRSVRGMKQLNKRWRVASVPGANSFTIDVRKGSQLDVAGGAATSSPNVSWPSYVSGGTVNRVGAALTATAAPSTATPITISWTAVTGARQYRIFREVGGIFAFVGVSTSLSFADTGYTPDVLDPAPEPRQPFVGSGNYPAAVGYFQQRRVFGSTTNAPQTVFASAIATGGNFTFRLPAQDSDSVVFAIQGRQVQPVRHLLDMDRLVVLTAGAVFTAEGNAEGTLTPTDINLRQRSFDGASTVQPIQIGQAALYVQARGSIVRDLVIDSASGFVSRDITIFCSHLFDGHEIVDWAYQQVPQSIIWAVRDDGVLLSLTYVREHDVWAWAEHETEGTVESVAVVPEGSEDRLYLQTVRTLSGATSRAIERMSSRTVTDVAEANFLDAASYWDGTGSALYPLTLSGGTAWTYDEPLTLTMGGGGTAAPSVGDEFHLTIGGETLRCRVAAILGASSWTVFPHMTVPAAFRGVATTSWGWAQATVTVSYLQGLTVGILGDGMVRPAQTVPVSGVVTIDPPAVKIRVGLPYTCDLELLDIEDVQSATLVDKKKRVNGVTVLVQDSRGMWAGPDEDTLWEWPQREGSSDPELFTGAVDIALQGRWKDDGRVLIRQVDPLPLRILGVVRRLIAS